jgi:TRAP-type C4-dicarboxylate transport system permease small subunit
MSSPSKFDRIVSTGLLVIGAVPLIVMMVVVTGNSLGRAIFRSPISGTIEIAGLAGAILVSAAVGFTARERGNVAVDALVSRLKPRVRAVFDAATFLLSLGGVSFLLYAVIVDGFKSMRLDDVTMTMSFPVAPFKFAWATGIFILACYLVVHLITAIKKCGEK